MSVLISGMEMPKVEDEFVEVLIFGDGKVIQTGKSWRCKEDGKCYYESITPELFYNATEIPEPHGRLIDTDAMIHDIQKAITPSWYIKERNADMVKFLSLEDAIIPASDEE